MTITIHDLRRAMLNKGDVSSFSRVYQSALSNSPVDITANFDVPLLVPTAETLPGANRGPSPAHIDLELVAVSRYGNNAAAYLERVIEQINPDMIALDICPVELGAHTLYACSLPYAAGLPIQTQVIKEGAGTTYLNDFFYPNSTIDVALTEGWLRSIPVIPVGFPLQPIQIEFDPWGGHVDPDYADKNAWESSRYVAQGRFEKRIHADTGITEGNAAAMETAVKLLDGVNDSRRIVVRDRSRYISAKITEIAASGGSSEKKFRVLALVDIAHYMDVLDFTSQDNREVTKSDAEEHAGQNGRMIMAAKILDTFERTGDADSHVAAFTTRAQRLFKEQLERFIERKNSAVLQEAEVDELVATVAERVRTHPDVARGLSVRGTIALKEILGGLSQIHGSVSRESLIKAAFITLPPRISLRKKGNEVAILGDILKEVLYRFRFGSKNGAGGEISATDMLSALNQLGALPSEESRNTTEGKPPAVVSETQEPRDALAHLEEMDFVRVGEQGEYLFTKEGLEFLMDGLEEKLKSGEISLSEYHQQKSWLMQQMDNISGSQASMSRGELANTIMEMIDAQDKQWNSDVNFNTMYVYYHIKANSGKEALSRQKSDYYGLRRVMDDLVRQNILVSAKDTSSCNLTGLALDVLFEYFVGRNLSGEKVQEITDYRHRQHNERSHEIRRFTSGDSYRSISVRRTLKEIARKRKRLSDVQRSDFRVFSMQSCSTQSDIILCLDTSGSMGFHQKLMYARLVAAGIVQAGLKNGNRIGIVAFNDYGKVAMPLTERDEDALLDFIAKISPRGNTNIGDGIKYSSDALLQDCSKNRKHIIVISDGVASAVSESTLETLASVQGRDLTEESALLETRKATARGIQVSVIHIAGKDEVSGRFINAIANVGNGKVYRISDSDALTSLFC